MADLADANNTARLTIATTVKSAAAYGFAVR